MSGYLPCVSAVCYKGLSIRALWLRVPPSSRPSFLALLCSNAAYTLTSRYNRAGTCDRYPGGPLSFRLSHVHPHLDVSSATPVTLRHPLASIYKMTRLSPPLLNRKTSSHRPTLPPLASLRLPDIRSRRSSMTVPALRSSNIINVTNAPTNDLLPPIPLNLNQHWPRPRQSSVSSVSSESSESSMTSETSASSHSSAYSLTSPSAFFSRAPSPELGILAVGPPAVSHSEHAVENVRRYHPHFDPAKHRIVLWHRFDDADAMLVFPLGYFPMDENFVPRYDPFKPVSKAYLVFGPTAWALRNRHNRKRLRAAVHPYRIVPRNPAESLPASGPASRPVSAQPAPTAGAPEAETSGQ
ncbi:hypothetical protein BD414DRAFT_161007 [Trametes punicea]|nr:hypothetical protein BD414DRAFT_161007 [Trametes punicea]